jgi:hypothetical protein
MAKPAQNFTSQVVTKPMERTFIDFVGPIVRTSQGNLAILVVLDGFSKVCGYVSCEEDNF